MRLKDYKYEEIKCEVIHMFIKYDIKCLPISGFEIATKMGIKLIPYSTLSEKKWKAAMQCSEDGFYFSPGNGTEYIYYNDSKSYERQNWTFLHELVHCVLGHHEGMDPDEAEAEANFFAKYAIAPPVLVQRFHPKESEDIEVVFRLSHKAALDTYEYYKKWLIFSGRGYTSYEMDLLNQFKAA